MNVVFFEVKDWEQDIIKKSFKDASALSLCKELLTLDNASEYAQAEVISTFINSKVTKDVLDKMPKLKLIATRSTGYDHIDLEYCKSRKIDVSNVPTYGENTVAEHAMALILSLTRRIPESIERVRRGKFSPEGLTGLDLKDKVMGVIGTGHIGRNLIAFARGFEMKVLAYDVKPDEVFANDVGFTYADLDYVLCKSDIVSLHVPYLESTHHIINRERISKMKKGVIVINTARGGLIETDALFDGLSSGQIGGAGLDVLEEEGFLKEEIELLHKDTEGNVDFKIALENHMMANLPNVIITPHNAFNSKEALMRIIDTTIDNIFCYSNGVCKNLVNKQ